MEDNIYNTYNKEDIKKILQTLPLGVNLYDKVIGQWVKIIEKSNKNIRCKLLDKDTYFDYSMYGTYKDYPDTGIVVLSPVDYNWDRLKPKKGDILVNSTTNEGIIYLEALDDGIFSYKVYRRGIFYYKGAIKDYRIVINDEERRNLIAEMEAPYVKGHYNPETGCIEDIEPKDGELLTIKTNDREYIIEYNSNLTSDKVIGASVLLDTITGSINKDQQVIYSCIKKIRYATCSEIRTLRSAEQKKLNEAVYDVIIDSQEFNTFDKVLVRHNSKERWVPAFYIRKYIDTSCPVSHEVLCLSGEEARMRECIPFEGNEYLMYRIN